MYHIPLQVIKIFGPLKSTFVVSQKQQWIYKTNFLVQIETIVLY